MNKKMQVLLLNSVFHFFFSSIELFHHPFCQHHSWKTLQVPCKWNVRQSWPSWKRILDVKFMDSIGFTCGYAPKCFTCMLKRFHSFDFAKVISLNNEASSKKEWGKQAPWSQWTHSFRNKYFQVWVICMFFLGKTNKLASPKIITKLHWRSTWNLASLAPLFCW